MIRPDVAELLEALSNDRGQAGQTAVPQNDPRAALIEQLMQDQAGQSRMPVHDPNNPTLSINRAMSQLYPVEDTYPDDPEEMDRHTSPQEDAIIELQGLSPDLEGTDTHVRLEGEAGPLINLTDPNQPDLPPERMSEDETQAFLRQIMGDKRGNIPTPRRNPLRR